MTSTTLPDIIVDTKQLEDLLSEPTRAAVQAMGALKGDLMILGAGGKMGPSLARMAVRASREAGAERTITAVSRFSQPDVVRELESHGVRTIRGDLLDEAFVAELPAAENVIFMTGTKFGTSQDPSATWAMNAYVPALVCRRYRGSRILAFSTGNVYPLVPIDSGGSVETDDPQPVGEYGMSALGRERMFGYFSRREATPVTILRLNYAVEMRYGVLVDVAKKVRDGQVIDLAMGYANVIWQGDANAMALAALADASVPPHVINVTGPERVSIREVAERIAGLLGTEARLSGSEAPTALLSNASQALGRYGPPRVPLERLISWTADWVGRGGITWQKPTHFEAHDGRF